jgi:23S rRNA pseudouridine1911/1915/1917 synthase
LQRPVAPDAPGAWHAEADFQVVERFVRRATSLEVSLISGRRNQIRLHAMLAGHPLVGEPLYRRRDPQIPFARQALHARRLVIDHPATGEATTLEAPIPPDLIRLAADLRGDR